MVIEEAVVEVGNLVDKATSLSEQIHQIVAEVLELGEDVGVFGAEELEVLKNGLKVLGVVFPGVVVVQYLGQEIVVDLFVLFEEVFLLRFVK